MRRTNLFWRILGWGARGIGLLVGGLGILLAMLFGIFRRHQSNLLAVVIAVLCALTVYLSLDNNCMRRWEGVPVQTRWSSGECQVRVEGLWRNEKYAVNYLKTKFDRDGAFYLSSGETYTDEFKAIHPPTAWHGVFPPPPLDAFGHPLPPPREAPSIQIEKESP